MAYTKSADIHKEQRVAPLAINESIALFEAQRCLYCFDAPCTQACPVNIDVPGFIKRLAEHNWIGSSQILYEANPIAAICGLVCPTDDLCEGACVLPGLGQTSIRIGALQYYVSIRQLRGSLSPVEEELDSKVAVVGGGPSGIGCAVVLRRLGYQVSIFDREQTLGGLISQVIPEYRLPQDVINHDLDQLVRLGIDFRLGTDIDKKAMEIILDEYDAVFLGIGLRNSRKFDIPGNKLHRVIDAMDFLTEAREYSAGKINKLDSGEKVVIVGGGNVALDAAVTAKQLGADRVIVAYRRSFNEMPAWRSEFLEASLLGVEFHWLSKVTEIKGDTQVNAVHVQPMRLISDTRGGLPWIENDPDAFPFDIQCDTVMLALGQTLEKEIVEAFSLEVTESGRITTKLNTFQTNKENIFAAGDTAGTGATVVNSLAKGMESGYAIHDWLSK